MLKDLEYTLPFPTIEYSSSLPFPTNAPAYQGQVKLGLTIVFTVVYIVIFLIVYAQLIAILYYRHKRLSYQTGFLFLCLFWSSLRIWLFSFYYKNTDDSNSKEFILYFLLYCFPVVLQFCILCLLVLFFGQLYFKAATRFTYERNTTLLKQITIICILFFLITSVIGSYIPRECQLNEINVMCQSFKITLARVIITDSLFVMFGIALGYFLFKLARLPVANAIMEQHGTSKWQSICVTIFTAFLFISRTFYNILAISIKNSKIPDFGYDWLNVSDQADLVMLCDYKRYLTFTCVLLIWEVIPNSIVLILFRIRCFNSTSNYSYNRRDFVTYPSQLNQNNAKLQFNYGKVKFVDPPRDTTRTRLAESINNNDEYTNENDTLLKFNNNENRFLNSYDSDRTIDYGSFSFNRVINDSESIINITNINFNRSNS